MPEFEVLEHKAKKNFPLLTHKSEGNTRQTLFRNFAKESQQRFFYYKPTVLTAPHDELWSPREFGPPPSTRGVNSW